MARLPGTRAGLRLRVARRLAALAGLRRLAPVRRRPAGRPDRGLVVAGPADGGARHPPGAGGRRASRSSSRSSGTQLALVLLAAPAATAGAICLDRARGTLDAPAGDRPVRRRDRPGQARRAAGPGAGTGRLHAAGHGDRDAPGRDRPGGPGRGRSCRGRRSPCSAASLAMALLGLGGQDPRGPDWPRMRSGASGCSAVRWPMYSHGHGAPLLVRIDRPVPAGLRPLHSPGLGRAGRLRRLLRRHAPDRRRPGRRGGAQRPGGLRPPIRARADDRLGASRAAEVWRCVVRPVARPVARRQPGPLARVAPQPAIALGPRLRDALHRAGRDLHGDGARSGPRGGGRGDFAPWVNGLQAGIGLLLVGVVAATSLAEERVARQPRRPPGDPALDPRRSSWASGAAPTGWSPRWPSCPVCWPSR